MYCMVNWDYVCNVSNVFQAVVTNSGALSYQYIIHAIGPIWDGPENKNTTQSILARTFLNAFQTANNDEIKAKSLVCPAISSGMKYIELFFYHSGIDAVCPI